MAHKPVTTKPATGLPAFNKPVVAKEKEKAIAFVNWSIPAEKAGDPDIIRSSKGFALYDNKYATLEDKALYDLAVANGGTATVAVELRIVVAQEKPASLDISKIKLVPQK